MILLRIDQKWGSDPKPNPQRQSHPDHPAHYRPYRIHEIIHPPAGDFRKKFKAIANGANGQEDENGDQQKVLWVKPPAQALQKSTHRYAGVEMTPLIGSYFFEHRLM